MEDKEFEEKYGNVELEFSSYYKYTFYFKGVAEDGTEISTSFGGNADDIYRQEVTVGKKVNFGCVEEWNHVVATKDKEKIFERYNF